MTLAWLIVLLLGQFAFHAHPPLWAWLLLIPFAVNDLHIWSKR